MYTFIKRQQDYFTKYAAGANKVNTKTTTPDNSYGPLFKLDEKGVNALNGGAHTTTPAKTPSAMDAYNKGMRVNNYTGAKARNYFKDGDYDAVGYAMRYNKAKNNDDRAKIQQEWTNAKNQARTNYINRLKSIDPKQLRFSARGNTLEWQDKYGNVHSITPEYAQAAGLNLQYAQQNDRKRDVDNSLTPGRQIGWGYRGIPQHELLTTAYGTNAMNKMWGWANTKTTANNPTSETPVNGASTGTGNPTASKDNSQTVNDPKQKQTTVDTETSEAKNPNGESYNPDEESTFKALYGDQKTPVSPNNNGEQNTQSGTSVEELSPEQIYKQEVMNWSKAKNQDIVAAQSRIRKWNASAKQRQAFEQSLNSRIKHLKEYAQDPEDLEELKKLESYKQQLQGHNKYMANLEKTLTTGIAQNKNWNAAQTGLLRRLFGDKVHGVNEDAYRNENYLNLSTGNNDANYLENNMNAINRFINHNYSGAEQRAADPRNAYRYAPWNQEMQRVGH